MKGWFGGGKKQPEPAGFDPEEAGAGGLESEKSFDPDGDGGAFVSLSRKFLHKLAARRRWLRAPPGRRHARRGSAEGRRCGSVRCVAEARL